MRKTEILEPLEEENKSANETFKLVQEKLKHSESDPTYTLEKLLEELNIT